MAVHSMTGFGRGTAASQNYRFEVTLRTVNHRFLDLSIRGPELVREVEGELRAQIEAVIGRGRVELQINVEGAGAASRRVRVDQNLLAGIQATNESLQQEGVVEGGLPRLVDLLKVPGLIDLDALPGEVLEEDRVALAKAIDGALAEVLAMRQSEGEAIRAALVKAMTQLTEAHRHIMTRRLDVAERLRQRLEERLGTLLGDQELEPSRLAQEVALLVEKSDITEELERWSGHIDATGAALEQRGPLGKRLDFLAQELLREINTVGSKARDLEVAEQVIAAKLACESLREQIQNVE